MVVDDKSYVYFVSFSYEGGFDSVEVLLSEEIRDIDMIAGITNDIEENIDVRQVQVLNFILLRVE